MADGRTKGRVRGLLGGASPDDVPADQAYHGPDPDAQRALQVLTLAQRTADEHVASAQHHADNIRTDARATAERIVRETQAHADGVRRDAEKVLSDARARAQDLVNDAQAHASELERQAQQRYDDIVGSLGAKRDALEQQIEALKQFDRDYRSNLMSFMQSQLRALGNDEPESNEDNQPRASVATSHAR